MGVLDGCVCVSGGEQGLVHLCAFSVKAQAKGPRASLNKSLTFVQPVSLFNSPSSPSWKTLKSILLYNYLNFLVRTLITRTSSTWVYHTIPYMSYTLKKYGKHSTSLAQGLTRGPWDLQHSTALWPPGYSYWWQCPKFSNLSLMFVSVRDIYNFFIESVYHQGLLSREYNSCWCTNALFLGCTISRCYLVILGAQVLKWVQNWVCK